MVEKKSNAKQFINAYNQIDYSLRVQHDFKRSMSFSDMIRRAVTVNAVVRKYEDDLIDFGRLRNAIIHRSNDDFIIAEPHDDVLEKILHIQKLITTPPKALDTVCRKDVLSVECDVCVKDVMKLIASSSYSNIPVYSKGTLLGIANSKRILDTLGFALIDGENINEFIENTKISEIITDPLHCNYFAVEKNTVSVEEVLDMFQKNRKLLVVLLTKDGSLNGAPLGVITSTDVMEMNNILDNY